MEKFQVLGLSQPILELLEKAGIREPSEIQEKAIPLVMQGLDVIGGSATGSGKTLAFGAGVIEKTNRGKGIQVLVITPTRELAEQIGTVLKKFSTYKTLNIAKVYGGVNFDRQVDDMRDSEIVIGTPGRILDHIHKRTINLTGIKTLILDEADRMLDMGFIEDVEEIIYNCPKERQTLLFSATISPDVEEMGRRYMKNPERASAVDYVDPTKLTQVYYDIDSKLKFSLLVHLLKKENSELAMIFCNTRRNTDFVAKNLRLNGINAAAIHGGLQQNKRNSIIKGFHRKEIQVLVCTDVAARGLDIKGVSHVYNYDIPKTNTEYIHRIGRTARAGQEGRVVNILTSRDYENFRNVMIDESIKMEAIDAPYVERAKISVAENNFRGRGHNSRNSGRGRDSMRSSKRRGPRDKDRGRDSYRGSYHSSRNSKRY